MAGYWARHRLLHTLFISAAVALLTSFLFVYPSILRQANEYNSQSIYKNSEIDFIAPEPSFDQVSDLPGTNGIERVFPFFLTKTEVKVNGTSRTTTLLLSDQFQNIDITMYSPSRLIEKADGEYENALLADWQFCYDTGSKIGDLVSINIGNQTKEYTIAAIYETNSIYNGGAVMAEISNEQKDSIANQSSNNGYSGMYVTAEDYSVCRSFLTTEYRPLGRLKDRSEFSDDDQYKVHYDAIMNSGYANEITDFRARESELDRTSSSLMVWIGAVLTIGLLIGFNMIMSGRGCERVYFTKQRIPKGLSVKPYYGTAFVLEMLLSVGLYMAFIILRLKAADEYIPSSAVGLKVVVVPVAIIIAEAICLIMNYSMVSEMTRKVELEIKKGKEAEQRAAVMAAAETNREDEP